VNNTVAMKRTVAMVGRRVGGTAVTLAGMVLLVFLAVRLVPGDPVDQLLGDGATEAERTELRTQMHLDGSLPEQLVATVGDIADGSLGTSYALRNEPTPVVELLVENAPHTLALALASLVFAVLLALPLGLLAAVRQDSLVDHGARGLALVAISTPAFVSGPLALYVLAVLLEVVPTPAHKANALQELALPACVIGFALSGRLARILRATALEQLRADYVKAAHLRGIAPWRVVVRHVLPNAALPVLTVLGLQLAALLGGALVTERIFARPGIGTLLLDGIAARDHAVVQACALVVGAAYAVVNGSIDVLYRLVDPRLRLPRKLR
jgi:peptide/nickel transport system permease protein